MPNWKVKSYKFSFNVEEVLKEHEPAHIHVETEKGKIEFWLNAT